MSVNSQMNSSIKSLGLNYQNTILIQKTINTLMNHFSMSLQEFETIYSMLNNKIDYKTYLILMSSKIVKVQEPEDIFTMIEDLIYTSYFIHLKQLVSNIDNKIAITNKNSEERLMPIYLKFEEEFIQGRYVSYYTNFYSCIILSDDRYRVNNEFVFPIHFIYWTEQDLIQQSIDFYNLNYVYVESLYSIMHSKIYSFVIIMNHSEFIKHIMNYYYMSLSKERLQIYEEELIKETWKPSRLLTFCLSEDEKMDIEMID